ncbi:hypothetical protein E1B28_011814 [Marasmius oreades]|uniref:Uncharacterized protein n=1 Tax=Marasmius oreades TaxID=181124 RepID=A0A9P7URL2_9AGAR|nr:uncharacterized protein E1B28_011814 [Marasmius oreades]KAG7090211.1 hypothetical protein E1B28_011814 [Marasmius oreades]
MEIGSDSGTRTRPSTPRNQKVLVQRKPVPQVNEDELVPVMKVDQERGQMVNSDPGRDEISISSALGSDQVQVEQLEVEDEGATSPVLSLEAPEAGSSSSTKLPEASTSTETETVGNTEMESEEDRLVRLLEEKKERRKQEKERWEQEVARRVQELRQRDEEARRMRALEKARRQEEEQRKREDELRRIGEEYQRQFEKERRKEEERRLREEKIRQKVEELRRKEAEELQRRREARQRGSVEVQQVERQNTTPVAQQTDHVQMMFAYHSRAVREWRYSTQQ